MTESKPSKTARKRELHALQQLGEQLITLQDADLEQLPLDEQLTDAVSAARRIKSHGALRRQKQLIGKLMRNIDAEPIRQALADIESRGNADKRLFAVAERWRDRVVDDGSDAIAEFRQETGAECDDLQALVGELERAMSDKARKTIKRRIFRAINDTLLARRKDDRIS